MSQSGTNQGSSRHSARGMRRRCVSLLTAASLCLALLTTGQTALGAEITDAGESAAAAVSEVTTSADAQITSSATQEITIVGSEDEGSTSEDTTTTESESSTSENQTSEEESEEESETEDTSADTTETEESDSTSEESEEGSEDSEDTETSEDSEDEETSEDSDDSDVLDEEEDDLTSEDEDSEEDSEDDDNGYLSGLSTQIADITITLEAEDGFEEDWSLSASSLSTSTYESLIDATLPEDTEETTTSEGSSESYETDSGISDSDDSDDTVVTTTVETSYSAEILSAISLSLTDGEGNSASLASEADLTFRGDVLEAGESSTTTKTYTTYSTSSENTKGEDLSNASTNESTDSVNSADSETTDSETEEDTVTVTVTTETTEEVRLYVLSSDGSSIQNTETLDGGSVTLSTQDISPIYTFARVTECVVTTVTSEEEVDEDEEITLVSDTEVDGITVSVTGTRAVLNGATGVNVTLASEEETTTCEELLNETTNSGEDADTESEGEETKGNTYSLYCLFDISLTNGDDVVEPQGTVKVAFSGNLIEEALDAASEAAKDETVEQADLVVVHFEEDDEDAAIASGEGTDGISGVTIYGSEENGNESLVVSDSEGGTEVSFETDSFSYYAPAVLTVTSVEDDEEDTMYIGAFSITETLTGTAPWDDDDSDGNDSGDSNEIIRSFDTLSYTLSIEMKTYGNSEDESVSYSSARLCFAFVIECSSDEAEFDTDSMAWMDETSGYEWEIIESTDDDGETSQILYCTYLMESADGNAVVPGTSTKNVSIYVKGMSNGETITPEFYAWMDGNDVYGDDGNDNGGTWYEGVVLDPETCCDEHSSEENSGKEIMYAEGDEITVSAALKMNVYLTSLSSYTLVTYDFNSGYDTAPFYGLGSVYGASYVMGISVQLYNDSADKGLKGLEYPTGDISFEIDISTKVVSTDEDGTSSYGSCSGTTDDGTSYDFSTLLYSYGPSKGSYTDNKTTNRTIKTVINSLPYNGTSTESNKNYTCTDGGTWCASQSGSKISVTISDYYIDGTFPITYTSATDKTVRTIDENIGTISTAQFTFITPYYSLVDSDEDGIWDDVNEDEYITDILGGVDLYTTISDTSLSAKSVSGEELDDVDDNSNQECTTDDSRSITARIDPAGSYSNYIMYAERDGYNQGYPLTESCSENGYDWAYQGQSIGIICGVYSASYYGNSNNYIIGYDDFVKIDADAVELTDYYSGWNDSSGLGLLYQTTESLITYPDKSTGSKSGIGSELTSGSDGQVDYYTSQFYPITSDVSISVLYAVLSDGKNWDSEDDMRNATQDDENILWYSSLNDVPSGYSVVGLLFQVRGEIESDSTTIYPRIGFYAKISDDAEVGSTYMLTDTVRVWTNRSLAALDEIEGYGDVSSIPSRLDEDNDGEYETGYNNVYLESGVLTYSLYPKYTKLTYNSDGSTSGGTPSGHNSGDTVLIVGYETNVNIRVLNGGSSDSSDTASNVYNLDYGQNIIDFSVCPTIDIDDSLTNVSSNVSATTTVYVTVTLPEGVSYIYGSSYYGGEYTYVGLGQRGTVTNGTALSESDSVYYTLTWNNMEIELTISLTVTVNSDGTTTLTYTFKDVPLSDSAYSEVALGNLIYFSVYIESGTSTQWTLEVSCASSGDGDVRDQTSSNGNYAETSVIVVQSSAGGISKTIDSLYNELDSELTWYVEHTNSGNTVEDLLLIDILPQKGYEGSWTLSHLSFDGDKLSSSETSVVLWYTESDLSDLDAGDFEVETSESGKETLSATDDNNVDWKELCKIVIKSSGDGYYTTCDEDKDENGEDYNFADLLESEKITGWALTGELGAGDVVYATESIKTSENEAGDAYQNAASYKTSSGSAMSGYATGWIYAREISGLVWCDSNLNGINDDNAPISGVTCTLYVYDEELQEYVVCTKDVSGEEIESQKTDSNGCYSFGRLAAGSYVVAFSDDESGVLEIYNGATTYQANGVNDDETNDGVALSTTNGTLDTEIELNGVEGRYAVVYDLSDDDEVSALELHEISEIVSYADDYVESVSHQDLGLAGEGYKLPETGGNGTIPYAAAGAGIIALAGVVWVYRKKHGILAA